MPNRLPQRLIVEVISSVIGLVLFGLALLALHKALGEFHYYHVLQHLHSYGGRQIALAFILTLISYLVLTAYDHLAVSYVRHPLPGGRITLASFICYAFSNNVGISLLTGGSLRYRFYSAWGLSGEEISWIVAFTAATFWLGVLTLASFLLLILAPELPLPAVFPLSARALGAILLIPVGLYLLACRYRRSLRVKSWEFTFPSLRLAIMQLLIGGLDWSLGGSILFILLPSETRLSFGTFLSIYLLAQVVALISNVPGGLGVFETLILLFLKAIPSSELLAALLIFRGIYYLFPLGVAAILLAGIEIRDRRTQLRRIGTLAGQWVSVLAPPMLAASTLVAGALLLFSGATPAVPQRLGWLNGVVPLPLLEASHFLGSLTGAALLLLARGLQRRLDGAFLMTVCLLVAGIIFSLLKGADYEEAAVLVLVLFALLSSRSQFYRSASLWGERFSTGWVVAILVVLLCSVWLGIFSYKHIEYEGELWWSFTLHGNAPRFLRAEVGAAALLLFFSLGRLLRPSRPDPVPPGPEELERARRIAQNSPRTEAYLALLGDKSLLLSDRDEAFIMYGIEGRSWVAMGDPVGSPDAGRELAWRFRELSERHYGWTVFYEVCPQNLPLYLDLGLSLLKIGETANIPLDRFSLEGRARKGLRQGYHRLEREGFQFCIAESEEVHLLIPELRKISDSWLAQKKSREKGFSLGFFHPEYLQRCPVALILQNGRTVAFSNLWIGATREEFSIDLMRYDPEISRGVIDYLLISLLLWGKNEGYQRFNLGMAPFAGMDSRPYAPLWNRLGAVIYRHGEHFYNFQGLRAYKQKFNPVWEPRYLALPGGIGTPQVLTNIATLISGGVKGIFSK